MIRGDDVIRPLSPAHQKNPSHYTASYELGTSSDPETILNRVFMYRVNLCCRGVLQASKRAGPVSLSRVESRAAVFLNGTENHIHARAFPAYRPKRSLDSYKWDRVRRDKICAATSGRFRE